MSKRVVLLEALASTPADLRLIVKQVDNAAAFHAPTPTHKSMAQLVHYLLAIEEHYQTWWQRVITEENPFLSSIRRDETAPTAAYFTDLLTRWETARAHTLAFLRTLPPGSWQRPAIHETQGATHLRYLVQMLVEHDTHHLNQLIDIQQRLRAVRGATPALSES